MKTKLLLLSAITSVALFTSCQKEEPTTPDPNTPETGAPAVLELRLAGADVASSRYVAPDVTAESRVTKGIIFVFKGTGADPALDARASFDFTATPIAPIKVNITQGIRQVYVVANVNPADFLSINTLTDLQVMTTKLTLPNFRGYASGALAMSGFAANVDATAGTVAAPTPVAVQLNFVGARIHVDWDITQLNPGLTGLTITGAAVLNVKAKSEYLATDNGAGGYDALTRSIEEYLRGINSLTGLTGSYLPAMGAPHNYDPELYVDAAAKGFAANHIYVFENFSAKPIIVTIIGTYNAKTYYWPIVINGTLNGVGGVGAGDQSGKVKRGMIYKVKATIKGLGNEDPYAPINPGAVDVTITPAAWQPEIIIDQEFS